MSMNEDIRRGLLEKVADLHGTPQGAYNIRENGKYDEIIAKYLG